MFNDIQNELNNGLRKLAENSLIKKLNKQDISRSDLTNEKFKELVELEMEIIKNDGKKVGAGIGVGIGISILTGGLI